MRQPATRSAIPGECARRSLPHAPARGPRCLAVAGIARLPMAAATSRRTPEVFACSSRWIFALPPPCGLLAERLRTAAGTVSASMIADRGWQRCRRLRNVITMIRQVKWPAHWLSPCRRRPDRNGPSRVELKPGGLHTHPPGCIDNGQPDLGVNYSRHSSTLALRQGRTLTDAPASLATIVMGRPCRRLRAGFRAGPNVTDAHGTVPAPAKFS